MLTEALIECSASGSGEPAADGTILYCNRCFADMLRMPHEKVIGSSVSGILAPAQRSLFGTMLRAGTLPQ